MASVFPFGYTGISLINIIAFRQFNRFGTFRFTQILISLLLPFWSRAGATPRSGLWLLLAWLYWQAFWSRLGATATICPIPLLPFSSR